ncbi:molybdate ABC transporter substrate-binding protein [Paludibaculum fermentans]|uniref:Molybdate ABC transporter substrate-binding protein n=1 Tax=Paludibaculum fermentans TaxID=1473598 RepID=A0A7S7SHN2_PALFE|nr:molybdate ABC transporter substrate-binding protein [Paludibaculum fermentans]QOY86107.1 molybdate ABC transporter substrate-binding protein [Paludibaculum fermentans]
MTIAAAADLTPLESALSAQSSTPVTWSFGSSGLLARQIRAGAPFDLYLSANEAFVQDLAKSDLLLPGSVRTYATGRLGLWSLSGHIRTLKDLTLPEVRHIALPNPQHAPYGAAARELLEKAGLWKQLQSKIVLAENVRQAYEFGRTGNADAVLTSWTLLHDQGGLLLNDKDHAPIRQSGGVVKGAKNTKAAQAFLDFLLSPAGQKILLRFGLTPAAATPPLPPHHP